MKQIEIDNLVKIKTEADILKLYPKAIQIQKKLQFVFYNIKPNVWIKCFYMMKDGTCCRDYTFANTGDVNQNLLSLESIYSGSEAKEDYKYIWRYSK
jgi:hypothetical protein